MSRLLLAFGLAALATSAHAADKGFYVGASVGQSRIEDVTDDLDFNADDLGLKVFAGFRFLDWLGAEASYVDFGSLRDTVLDNDIDGDSHAIDAYVVGFLPVAGFDLFAKAGLVNWDSKFNIDDLDFSDKHDGTDAAYGVGAQFRLGSAALRAEYEVFDFGDDANMLSVGASWTFL